MVTTTSLPVAVLDTGIMHPLAAMYIPASLALCKLVPPSLSCMCPGVVLGRTRPTGAASTGSAASQLL